MDKSTVAFLLNEGYQIGRLHRPGGKTAEIPKDVIVVGTNGDRTEYVVTSTRAVLIGRELPGGPLGEEWGLVCAEDTRATRFANTLGGGRLEPYNGEYRAEGDTNAEETVVECLQREVLEELGISLGHSAMTLIGVRIITEQGSNEVKRINGKVCVDAYFCGFVDERLPAHYEKNGETGERRVLSPEDLLFVPDRDSGLKLPLPQTQRLAVATSIITINDLWRKDLPSDIMKMIERSLPLARQVFQKSQWARLFVPLIEQS